MWFVILVIINVILPCVLGEESQSGDGTHWMDFWVVRLLLNLLGYATIFVPGYLLMRYLRNIRYNETAGKIYIAILNSVLPRSLKQCGTIVLYFYHGGIIQDFKIKCIGPTVLYCLENQFYVNFYGTF